MAREKVARFVLVRGTSSEFESYGRKRLADGLIIFLLPSIDRLQILTGEILLLAALPVTVHQNETERKTLHEILDSEDLYDSSVPVTDVGILGIRRPKIQA